MVRIDLKEYAPSDHVLSLAQRDTLLGEADTLNLSIQPVVGTGDSFRVTAGHKVGAIEIGDMSVLIEPKIGIPRLLSLACYAMGVFRSQHDTPFDFKESEALPDVLAIALASAARGAFVSGLLHGYRTEEEALPTVRGRIRLEDQMRRRFGVGLPVEVRYDEFTDDVLENRLVKAAASRLGRMRLRSVKARRGLSWVAGMLEQVSLVEFGANDVPETRFDRLNEHYRSVVGLSRLVLRHSEFESGRGGVRASGFLMNMNDLFQEFVTVALREALGVSEQTLRSDSGVRGITLDEGGLAGLQPDLSWWDGSTCTFVGDAKYKNLTGKRVAPGADLYQLLAYATALDLPGGLLRGEDPQRQHHRSVAPSRIRSWPSRVRHPGGTQDRDAVSHARTGDQSLRERPQASDQARQEPGQALECRRSGPVRLRSSSPQPASPPVGAVVCLLGVSHRAGLAVDLGTSGRGLGAGQNRNTC